MDTRRSTVLILIGVLFIVLVHPAAGQQQVLNLYPHQNPATRQEILFSSNREDNRYAIYSINPNGTRLTKVWSTWGIDELEARISNDGKYIALLWCYTSGPGCNVSVRTYPAMAYVGDSGIYIDPAGSLWWDGGWQPQMTNVLYYVEAASHAVLRTKFGLGYSGWFAAGIPGWPQGSRYVVQGGLLTAYEANGGTVIKDYVFVKGMHYPTVAAANTVINGVCGSFFCEYETIVANHGDQPYVSQTQVDMPEMAFDAAGKTSLVFVRDRQIYLSDYRGQNARCLTCTF